MAGWLLINDAPLDEWGHLWSSEFGDRLAEGKIYAHADGSRAFSTSWHGCKFTHWHPFPQPPPTTEQERENG
jgi:hypothetical protein